MNRKSRPLPHGRFTRLLCWAGTLLCLGCGGTDAGDGSVMVTTYGEAFIEDGITAEDMNDGWAITFERFDVTFSDVQVGGVSLEGSTTIDVAASSEGDGHELGQLTVPAGDHDASSFTITRVEIEGSATRDDVLKTFAWTFDEPARYDECETTTSVAEGESATFQITIHADHLFYNSLVSEEPELLFSALADADENGNGEITQEELGATDIGAYDAGNEDIDDLWHFLVAQSATLGHVDGEGHCHAAFVN